MTHAVGAARQYSGSTGGAQQAHQRWNAYADTVA